MTSRPNIVCLCGSTRFSQAYQQANLEQTLAGHIVLTIGCDMKSDLDLFATLPPAELETIKRRLDELHRAKIDLADEILVLNVDGYVGEATAREIAYARSQGKGIRWLEQSEDEERCRCSTGIFRSEEVSWDSAHDDGKEVGQHE